MNTLFIRRKNCWKAFAHTVEGRRQQNVVLVENDDDPTRGIVARAMGLRYPPDGALRRHNSDYDENG